MRSTVYLIFFTFWVLLLLITKSHSAYADDGLMIDKMLDAIATHNVETTYETKNTKFDSKINNFTEEENKYIINEEKSIEADYEDEVKDSEEEKKHFAYEEIFIGPNYQTEEKESIHKNNENKQSNENIWWNEDKQWWIKITVWWSEEWSPEGWRLVEWWSEEWWETPWLKPWLPGEWWIHWWWTQWWWTNWWDDTLDYLCDLDEWDWNDQEYVVTFNTDWWENIQPMEINKWDSIEELPVPSKTWYKFWWRYWGEFYVINSDDLSYDQWCNSPELLDADKYCIFSLPVGDDTNMDIYVSPSNLEIVWSACSGEQYCHSLNIWEWSWWLPISYFSKLKTEWLLDSYTFGENYNIFWQKITDYKSLIYNLNAKWSEKNSHYRWQYMNINKSNNCTVSGACGKEDSTKNLSIRCISVTNDDKLSFWQLDESVWAVRYNWWPIIQDTTLYAKWDWCDEWYVEDDWKCIEWIKVIFDAETNWGKTITNTITVFSWTTINLSEFVAVKSWYNFIWWNTDPNATEKLDDNYVVEKWETMYWIFNKTLTISYSQWEWVESIDKTFDTCEIFNNEESCNVEIPLIVLKEWYKNWYWLSDQWNIMNEWWIVTISDNVVYTATAVKISGWQSGWWKKWSTEWSSESIITPDNNQNNNQNTEKDSSNNMSEKQNSSFSNEFYDAYEFAYKHWITTKPTIKEAQMYWKLTRIEMAKMLSQYAIKVLWKIPDVSLWSQSFIDVSKSMDEQYNNAVTLSYQLWIMWQNMKNNRFNPKKIVTRAELVTALSRMLYWLDDGIYESTWKFYIPHISKLYNEWLIQEKNPNIQERRWYLMLMLMRSVK